MQEVFDIKFRNRLGSTLGLEDFSKPLKLRKTSLCSFLELGPVSFLGKNNIRGALNWFLNTHRDNDTVIALRLSKSPDVSSEEQFRKNMLLSFTYAYDFADFFVLDFGRPEIGAVQELDFIRAITDPILDARMTYEEFKPVLLKLSPILNADLLEGVLDYCMMNGIDGVELSDIQQIKNTVEFSKGRLPIIGAVHAPDATDISSVLEAGASLADIDAPHIFRPQIKYIFKSLKNL